MKYTKRGLCRTFPEYIQEKTGKSLTGLNRYYPEYTLLGLDEAAERFVRAVQAKKHMEIHTDYDADGIGCAVQFQMILRALHAGNYRITVPKRFSDGYGIKKQHVEAMPGGLLITADNGITALEAIAEAKRKGMDVIVLDHHLAGSEDNQILLPDADLIIDPEALPEGNDFTGYCAAGLVNRLVRRMFPNDPALLQKANAVAAISTIADSVPLTEDNRRLVQDGLFAMNRNRATAGINEICNVTDLTGHVTSEDIAYTIAPMFNAPGRLYDTGAFSSAIVMAEEDPEKAMVYAAQLKAVNESRKQQTKEAVANLVYDPSLPVQMIRADHVNPGLLGIVAGKVTEETGVPSFVYRCTNGVCGGSARSDDETRNNVKAMLDSCSDLLLSYGGHAGAAGFKFTEENEAAVKERMLQYPVKPHLAQYAYDLELDPVFALGILSQMDHAEPFGKGMEKPVFRLEAHFTGGDFWKPMGDGSHLSFRFPGSLKAVGFHMRERYAADGYPKDVMFYGDLSWNWYKGKKYPNFRIDDYEVIQ